MCALIFSEKMYKLPDGLDCPNCRDGVLRRLEVIEDTPEKWIVEVQCINCLFHPEYLGEESLQVRIPRRSHPAVDGI